MSEEMKVTCLHDKHVALGALMSPFGGFDMPIQYKGIVDEHNAVRNQVGVFDVSHMGEVEITGPEAEKFVNYIFTNDITDAPVGKIFSKKMHTSPIATCSLAAISIAEIMFSLPSVLIIPKGS